MAQGGRAAHLVHEGGALVKVDLHRVVRLVDRTADDVALLRRAEDGPVAEAPGDGDLAHGAGSADAGAGATGRCFGRAWSGGNPGWVLVTVHAVAALSGVSRPSRGQSLAATPIANAPALRIVTSK